MTHLLLPRLTVSGVVGALAGAIIQIGTHADVSPETIVTSTLTGICVFLFTMFIRQGNKLARLEGETAKATTVAALEAYQRRNKDDLERLDSESRSVDKRISDSRHLVKNEMTPLIAASELRLSAENEALWASVRGLEQRLGQHIDKGDR